MTCAPLPLYVWRICAAGASTLQCGKKWSKLHLTKIARTRSTGLLGACDNRCKSTTPAKRHLLPLPLTPRLFQLFPSIRLVRLQIRLAMLFLYLHRRQEPDQIRLAMMFLYRHRHRSRLSHVPHRKRARLVSPKARNVLGLVYPKATNRGSPKNFERLLLHSGGRDYCLLGGRKRLDG